VKSQFDSKDTAMNEQARRTEADLIRVIAALPEGIYDECSAVDRINSYEARAIVVIGGVQYSLTLEKAD
jgi:hypothetical protein